MLSMTPQYYPSHQYNMITTSGPAVLLDGRWPGGGEVYDPRLSIWPNNSTTTFTSDTSPGSYESFTYDTYTPSSSEGGSADHYRPVRPGAGLEHMFEKQLTPSDVGKLNRLVIPKQHAERYFPMGPEAAEKGLLLNFEDQGGKSWKFRYSYWNSSQSYVLTKGWSRFVKENRLNAGDTVLFQRRAAAIGAEWLLYIGWRRRADSTTTMTLTIGESLPPTQPAAAAALVQWGRRVFVPQPVIFIGNENPVVVGEQAVKPVSGGVKRLRLFGVNLDCPVDEIEELA